MQIYGIDLAKEKFDVSFLRLSSKSNVVTPVHHVVRNTQNGIKAFLKGLPSDSVLVAEHTGVYGERLLKMCTEMNVKIAYVGGHVIHTYKSGPDRGKTDEQDCNVLREFGERFTDKLVYTTFPEEEIYELRQLSRQRTMLVEERKRIMTADKTEDCRPYRSEAVKRSMQHIVDLLDEEIKNMERDMLTVIRKHDKVSNSYDIITSVNGVGLVTAVELIVKTRNFTTITTAKQYSAYAGTAPYEKSSGKMNQGAHVSKWGNRRSKTLLYICAECARMHNKEMKLYYERRTIIDKKAHHYVLNAIANKLLRLIFSLINKNEKYNPCYIQRDPRSININ